MMNTVISEIYRRAVSFNDADLLDIFGDFRNDVVSGSMPVVLYGAGSAGKELLPVLNMHGIHPVCFCDGNPLRAGDIFCGLPIISISELSQKHGESLVIITVGAVGDQIKEQLARAGLNAKNIMLIPNQEALCYYTHLAQWHWPKEDLLHYQEDLLSVYHALSDMKSRDIFASRIALFAQGADYRSFCDFLSRYSDVHDAQGSNFNTFKDSVICDVEAYLQFNNDVLVLKDNELFVDGGAYIGDSTVEFIRACDKNALNYAQIVCFEPEHAALAKLKKNVAEYRAVSVSPLGLWSSSTVLRFADSSVMRPGSTKFIDHEEFQNMKSGVLEIPTTSIDEYFPDENITLIKMDVEGAEMEALHGAEKTLARCRPKLIISAYHKRNDLFEIPLFIHRLVPEYKLYFRHFSRNFAETTLFAIP